MVVLPALVALPAVKVKLTALPDKFTVNDSGSVAVNVMVCGGLEFNCAEAPETTAIVNRATINNRAQFIEIDFIRMSFSRFLLVKHSFYCTRWRLGVIAYWVLLTGSCSLGLAFTGSYRVNLFHCDKGGGPCPPTFAMFFNCILRVLSNPNYGVAWA